MPVQVWLGAPVTNTLNIMAFTITNKSIVSDRRQATLDRLTRRIANLTVKDELTDRQQDRLDRYQSRLERLAPKDSFDAEYNGDFTWNVTITDSPWDDTIIGGESYKLRLSGTDYNPPKGWRRRFGSSMFDVTVVEGQTSTMENVVSWNYSWSNYVEAGYEDFEVSLCEETPGPRIFSVPVDLS